MELEQNFLTVEVRQVPCLIAVKYIFIDLTYVGTIFQDENSNFKKCQSVGDILNVG